MSPLPQLPPALLLACYDEAQRRYPNEACGLLCGPRGGVFLDAMLRCPNDQDRLHALDPREFPFDGRSAFRLRFADVAWLFESLETERPAQVLFHSHCDAGADLSPEDRSYALADGSLPESIDHLVIDVARGHARGARRYRRDSGRLVCVAVYDSTGRLRSSQAID